jgi:hypothetical protein
VETHPYDAWEELDVFCHQLREIRIPQGAHNDHVLLLLPIAACQITCCGHHGLYGTHSKIVVPLLTELLAGNLAEFHDLP